MVLTHFVWSLTPCFSLFPGFFTMWIWPLCWRCYYSTVNEKYLAWERLILKHAIFIYIRNNSLCELLCTLHNVVPSYLYSPIWSLGFIWFFIFYRTAKNTILNDLFSYLLFSSGSFFGGVVVYFRTNYFLSTLEFTTFTLLSDMTMYIWVPYFGPSLGFKQWNLCTWIDVYIFSFSQNRKNPKWIHNQVQFLDCNVMWSLPVLHLVN